MLWKSLHGAITNKGIDVRLVDKVKVNLELKRFKDTNGSIKFGDVFKIPVSDRIPALAEKDLEQTILVISVALTTALEGMNLSRPMTNTQILDLAEIIVDTSTEDKLSLEDLMLFLQKLIRGDYPGLYEGMDIPKFMERFNQYRDDRWTEGIRIRDERDAQYKGMGDLDTFNRSNPNPTTAFGEQLNHYRNKVQQRNDEIELLRKENKNLRDQRDF